MCIFFFVSHYGVSFSWKCVSDRPVPYPFAFVADTNRQFIRRMCPQNASIHDKQSVLARAAEENPPSNVIIDFYRLLQSTLLTQIRNRKEPHLMTINYVKEKKTWQRNNRTQIGWMNFGCVRLATRGAKEYSIWTKPSHNQSKINFLESISDRPFMRCSAHFQESPYTRWTEAERRTLDGWGREKEWNGNGRNVCRLFVKLKRFA